MAEPSRRAPLWVTLADIVACGLLALASWAVVTGRGPILHVGPLRIQATSEWRLVAWTLLVIAVRHAAFRGDSLWRRLGRLVRRVARIDPPLGHDEYLARLPARRLTFGEIALVAASMLVLTAAMTYPQIVRLDWVRNLGDPLFATWRFAWIAHQLPRDPLHLFAGNIYHPAPLTLAYSDSTLLPALLAAPLYWLGVPAVRLYNVWLLATFVLCGVAMYALVRSLTGQRSAAAVAGVLFAFYPFRFEHYDCVELLFAFWMPLALLALHRTLANGRLRDGLMTGAAVAGQMLSGIYLGLFLAAYLVPVGGALALAGRRVGSAVKPLAAGALLASTLTLPMVVPHLQARRWIGERTSSEVEAFSSTAHDYLVADTTRFTWSNLLSGAGGPERSFPGLLIVALALVALVPPLSAPRIAYALGLVFAFEASLGTHGYVFPFLFRVLVPFRGLRAPGRFSICVGLSLAVLAGYGMARLNARLRRRSVRHALMVAVCIVALVESRSALPLDRAPNPELVYRWFDGRGQSVVAELPASGIEPQWVLEARYTYVSTFHWQRIVNGYSGVIPAPYARFMADVRGFPDETALRALRAHGVQYVIVHEASYGRAAYAKVIDAVGRTDDLQELVATGDGEGEARIYRLVR